MEIIDLSGALFNALPDPDFIQYPHSAITIEKEETHTLIIDGIGLLLAIPDKSTRVRIIERLEAWGHQPMAFSQRQGYAWAYRLMPPIPSDCIEARTEFFGLWAGRKEEGRPFIRLDWNPSKFSAADHAWLLGHLGYLIAETPHNLGQAAIPHLVAAKVSRLHIAVDIKDIRPGDYYWQDPKALRQTIGQGAVETVNLGKPKSNQFTIYDKTKERLDKAGKVVPHPLTRVEAKLRFTNNAPTLGGLSKLRCFDIRGAAFPVPPDPGALHTLAIAANAVGLDAALAGYPAPLRLSMAKTIRASVPPWWRPAEFWQAWPAVCAATFDPLFGALPL